MPNYHKSKTAHHANKAAQRDKVWSQRPGQDTVISSNVTSSHFLGSAPRSWMVNDTQDGSIHTQPGRRYSNPTRPRPKPQRFMTSLPAEPLVETSTIEIISRPSNPCASSKPRPERRASTTHESCTQARHVSAMEHAESSPAALHRSSVSNATSVSMVLDSPSEPAENASREGSQAPGALPDPPGQAHLPAISNDIARTIYPPQEADDAQQRQLVQPGPVVELGGLSFVSGAEESAEIEEPSRIQPTNEQQDESVQPRTAANTDGVDELPAEIVALTGNDAPDPATAESLISTTGQDQVPLVASPGFIVLDHSGHPQCHPRSDNAGSANAFPQHDVLSVGDTPPANAGRPGGGRKRSAEIGLSGGRSIRARKSADVADVPAQLPTPQDSPITTTTATPLGGQFESRLTAVLRGPTTVNQGPVINGSRIELMREACRRNDHFYVLIHAIFCVFSAAHVEILRQLQFTEAHTKGLQVLESILGSNRRVTEELFRLFVCFPQTPEELVQDKSHGFMVLIEEVRCFLYHLAFGFAHVRDDAVQRKWPPCPAELKFLLKLPSPVLQNSLFTSILRWNHDDERFIELALSLFNHEMSNPAGSAISISALNDYHGSQLPGIVSHWALVYGQLLKQYEDMKTGQQMQSPQPQPPPAAGPGPRGAQVLMQPYPHESISLMVPVHSHSSSDQPTYPASPATIQRPSQMSHHSNSPHPQQYYHPTPPQSFLDAPQPTLLSTSSNSHQPVNYNPDQIQHTPYSHYPPNVVQNSAPITANLPSQTANPSLVPHPQFTNGIQRPPVQVTETDFASPSPSSMGRVDTSLSSTAQPQRPRSSRKRWTQVETLLENRVQNGKTDFFIRWIRDSPSKDSWVPKSCLQRDQRRVLGLRKKKAEQDPSTHQRGGDGMLLPSHPMDQTQLSLLNSQSMPSTIVQQHQTLSQQLVPNALRQQTAVPEQAAAAPRSQQLPTMAQTPQAPYFQRLPMSHMPAEFSRPIWRPGVPVPPVAIAPATAHTAAAPANLWQQSGARMPPLAYGADHVALQTALGPNVIQSTASSTQHYTTPGPSLLFFHGDANYTLPQAAIPEPHRAALHQAGLASPVYHKMTESDGNETDTRYYQFVEDIIELPQLVTKDADLIRWKVRIPPEVWIRRTLTLPAIGEFSAKERNVSDGDAQFRLKSIICNGQEGQTAPTLSEFCTQPTKWPKCLTVAINGDEGIVDFRRKAHWGADLATDVTELLDEGDNELVIGAIFTAQETSLKFLIAIEIICVADHNRVLRMPTRIPAADSLAAITHSLGQQGDGDDDLIIEQRGMSIDLIDPFMSVIWVTPVRGQGCAHRECFDLSAFLLSRTSRVTESGLTSPDKWHCPICKSDCRPPMLVIDEFLLGVRSTLARNDQLHAKAIFVQPDGSWEPKLAQSSRTDNRDTPDPDVPMTGVSLPVASTVTRPEAESASVPPLFASSASSTPRPPIDMRTVIVLDDDDD